MTTRAPLPQALSAQPFTTSTALASGMSPGRLRAGDLDARFHGIRFDAARPQTLESLCRARSTRFPPDAFISGPTAAVLRAVPLPSEIEQSTTIHVTVPEGRRALSGRGLVGHSARLRDGDVVYWKGLRLSSPSRMWCELGRSLSLHDLVAAGDYLVHRDLPHTSIAALGASQRVFAGRRGAAKLAEAIALLDDNTASRRESHLKVLAVLQGFRGFVMNMEIRTSSGYTYFGDLTFPAERVIVEYQSEYHFDPKQQRKDMTRRTRLEADDWMVIYVNADDLRDPRELAARIRALMSLHSRHLVGGTHQQPTK